MRSAWPFPFLPPSPPGPHDVEIAAAPLEALRSIAGRVDAEPVPAEWCRIRVLDDGAVYLRWSGLFRFLVSADGARIVGEPLGPAWPEAFNAYLLGQVLSFALLKRGAEPLHATALVDRGVAFALLGDSGAGKSTLAAGLLAAGCQLLTDDVLVLDDRLRAFPGPPRIKLFPEAAGEVIGPSAEGVPMNPLTAKRILGLPPEQIRTEPSPLTAMFVLDAAGGDRVSSRRLSRQGAFVELGRATYNPILVDEDRMERHFAFATELARAVPMLRLRYPRRYDALPRVVARVLARVRAFERGAS